MSEIERLKEERSKLEEEQERSYFIERLDRHKAKLDAELQYLRKQYNEIEQIKTAVYNNQNIGAPQAVAQAASEVKCADKDGNPEPCEPEKPEEEKENEEQELISGEQQTQLAKMGDGTFEEGAFDGLS